jgi:hypothetical protein
VLAPNSFVGVAACYAQRNLQILFARIPRVDIYFFLGARDCMDFSGLTILSLKSIELSG